MEHDPYQALRFKEFRHFLEGTFVLSLATQIQTLVMGWQVYQITHDPLSLGLIGLAEAVPFLGLSLLGGWAADRWDRRGLALTSQATLLLGALLLLGLNLHGAPTAAWPFYAIQALSGLGRAFYRPASQALSTELLPREAYMNAATWRSSSFMLAMVSGPAVGGLLYGFGSPVIACSAEVAMVAVAIFAMVQVKPRPRVPSNAPILQSLGEGIAFVFNQRLVLSALSLDLFAVLFGGAVALLPVFAADVLKIGPQGLGVLRAGPAVGSVVMGLVLAHYPPRRKAGMILLACVAGYGLCWIGFARSSFFAVSFALLVLSGVLDSVSMVLRGTLVQLATPPEMMGRVQAVNGFFIGSSNELGAFESGVAARLLGVVPSVVFGGLMTLGVVGFTAWRVPELRNLEKLS